jgi:hypothetical protein
MTVREKNLASLKRLGFKVAPSLPTVRHEGPVRLRPLPEIIGRAAALNALFVWVSAPEDMVPAKVVAAFVKNNKLRDHLTAEERQPLDLPRPAAMKQHVDSVGWKLENIWPLAWVLGYEPAPPLGGMADRDQILAMIEFLPRFDASVADWAKAHPPRPVEEVDALEDLFYCAHNAVRSAQLGGSTVPKGFHPVRDGGVVHERRHALTWALSPGVAWEDTDLST